MCLKHVWRVVVVVIVTMSVASAGQRAPSVHFTSTSNGYEMSVPDGWVRIGSADLQARFATTALPGNSFYEAAFQLQGTELFSCPYVLIQVIPHPKRAEPSMADLRQLVAAMNTTRLTDVGDKIPTETLERLGQISVTDARLDESRIQYAMNLHMSVDGVGQVRGYCRGFIGNTAIVQVICYTLESDFMRLRPQFDEIHDSVRFHPVAAFKGTTPNPRGTWDGVAEDAIVGGITGGIVGLFVTLYYFRKAKRRTTSR